MSHAHKFQEFLWSLLFVKFNYHSQRLERRVWSINSVLHLKNLYFYVWFSIIGKRYEKLPIDVMKKDFMPKGK